MDVLQLKDNVIPRGLIPLEELFDQDDVAKKLSLVMLEILSLMEKDMAKELSSKCSKEEQKECIYSLSYRAAVSVKEIGKNRL